MTDTAVRIHSYQVPEKRLGVFFMGQAGVILKAPDNTLLAVDLYLSDCCERYFGFKRLMPKLVGVDDLRLDYVCATHAHFDHLIPIRFLSCLRTARGFMPPPTARRNVKDSELAE